MEPLNDIDTEIVNVMNNMIECKYHTALETIYDTVWEKIDSRYNWDVFDYWLADESNLGRIYEETFHLLLGDAFTDEHKSLLGKKGDNLEATIGKWLSTWKQNHPNLPNEKMPKSCLRNKIYQYIIYQLNKPDLRILIGSSC
jgi:hypothetical protein